MTDRAAKAVVFVESNTSGTGRLFVHAARALGFRPVLVTANPSKYAYLAEPGAPEVVPVPAVDEEALFHLVRDRFGGALAGITSSSEYFVATAAALAARFGLPAPDADAVRAARDKSWQRRALEAGGVAGPAYRAVASAAGAVAAADGIGYPVVLKPVSGSGSVGVRACADADQVQRHAAALFADASGDARVLVEALVEGPEFSVEVFDGRAIGVTRKHLGAPPAFVETGHDFPAPVEDGTARTLIEAVLRGTEILRLGWGPLHWELRMRGGVAVPMEVNPRLAGGFIPELVRHAHGIDLIEQTLRRVTGLPVNVEPARRRHASIRFLFAPANGRLAAVEGVEDARAAAEVVDVALYRRLGDEIALHGDFRDRVGHVMACADDAEAACAAAENARRAVRLCVSAAEDVKDVQDVKDGAVPLAGAAQASGGAMATSIRTTRNG
jgi:biotin carboxylase